MSYEIEYGRQFVRSGEGITPMVLMGSSNCYEDRNGFWRRERSWMPFCGLLGISENAFLEFVEQMKNASDYASKGEHWKRNGSFLTDDGMMRWVKSGIKEAKPIEEVCELNPSLSLEFSLFDGNEFKEREYVTTTDGVDRWIRKTRELGTKCQVRFTQETFAKPKTLREEYSYVIRFAGQLVTKIDAKEEPDGSISVTGVTTASRSTAEPRFYTARDVILVCRGINKAFAPSKAVPVHLIDTVEPKPTFYVIRIGDVVGSGRFVTKVTSKSVYTDTAYTWARKYTKASAVAAVNRLNKRSFKGIDCFHYEEIETE